MDVRPTPSDEEMAAIAAAVEVLWPRPVVLDTTPAGPPPWRFSGRWWRRPGAARRQPPP
jgi:hypothetical protein